MESTLFKQEKISTNSILPQVQIILVGAFLFLPLLITQKIEEKEDKKGCNGKKVSNQK
ncbi:hypothetical protein kam1_618 [Methylacidiphilum kamchatkense Kam1]|uniref:Uncharacterized protein n=1 Tax=Methylacidiphilum kamchatkense Kam1 TaxID=1202785 RepID=A0A516TKW4_9BACT|nr:hypothetical protein kam1_618 [Methylacidiphilum kamchatkense Kam1]